MKDILGTKLQINDYIAFSLYEESRMQLGQIIGFTKKQAKIRPLLIIKPKNRRTQTKLSKPSLLRKPKHLVRITDVPEEYKTMPPEWVGQIYRK